MKPRTFAFIAAALLALIVLTNRIGATKNEDALQNALSLLFTGDETVAEAVGSGDAAEKELLRQRFEPYCTDSALNALLSTGLPTRVPALLAQTGAEITFGSLTLEGADNAMGYVFSLPLHCVCGGVSRDFTITGYAAFSDDRLAALTVEGADALERWLTTIAPAN